MCYALAVGVLAGLLLIGLGAANLLAAAPGGWSVLGLGVLVVAAGTLLLVIDPPLQRSAGKQRTVPGSREQVRRAPVAPRSW